MPKSRKSRSVLRLPEVPAAIRKLLGPPPLLSTENEKFYYAMLAHFAATVENPDLVTWLLLKDVADARVEITRCRNFKTLRIAMSRNAAKRGALKGFNRESKIEFYKSQVEAKKLAVAKSELSAEEKEAKSKEWDQALASAIRTMETDYAKLVKDLSGPDTALDFVQVFRSWVEDFERLDVLLRAAEDRFKAALLELDRYQNGRSKVEAEELDIIEGKVLPLPICRLDGGRSTNQIGRIQFDLESTAALVKSGRHRHLAPDKLQKNQEAGGDQRSKNPC